jgi:hypothetical protein
MMITTGMLMRISHGDDDENYNRNIGEIMTTVRTWMTLKITTNVIAWIITIMRRR